MKDKSEQQLRIAKEDSLKVEHVTHTHTQTQCMYL